MQELDEDDQNNQQEEDNAGGGIWLGNRRGGKKGAAKGGVDRSNLHKKVITTGKSAPGGGVLLGTYDEKDVSQSNFRSNLWEMQFKLYVNQLILLENQSTLWLKTSTQW